nr:DUF6879 family protein [Micromonospora pisi]
MPVHDFWLLDGEVLAVAHHGGDGQLVEVEILRKPALAAMHAEAFEQVWELAVPHADYVLAA